MDTSRSIIEKYESSLDDLGIIILQIEKNDLDKGLKSLCGAASSLSLKNYRLYSFLIEISIAKNFSVISIYEGILQCYLFLGFPRAIEGLKRLQRLFMENGVDFRPPIEDKRTEYLSDGIRLCKRIYRDKYPSLMEKMKTYSPELAKWMLMEGYGRVLSRDGLSAKSRELIAVSALVSEGVPNQLSAHIRGALNVGAKPEELAAVFDLLKVWVDADYINEAYVILKRL